MEKLPLPEHSTMPQVQHTRSAENLKICWCWGFWGLRPISRDHWQQHPGLFASLPPSLPPMIRPCHQALVRWQIAVVLFQNVKLSLIFSVESQTSLCEVRWDKSSNQKRAWRNDCKERKLEWLRKLQWLENRKKLEINFSKFEHISQNVEMSFKSPE